MTLKILFQAFAAVFSIGFVAGFSIQNDGPGKKSSNNTQTTKFTTTEEAAAYFLSELRAMKEEQRQHSISLTNVLTRIVTSSFKELKRELKAEIAASTERTESAITELKESHAEAKSQIKKDVIKVRKKLSNVDSFLRLEVTQMFQSRERENEGLRYALKDVEERQKGIKADVESVLEDGREGRGNLSEELGRIQEAFINRTNERDELNISANLHSIDNRLNQSLLLLTNISQSNPTKVDTLNTNTASTSAEIAGMLSVYFETTLSNISQAMLTDFSETMSGIIRNESSATRLRMSLIQERQNEAAENRSSRFKEEIVAELKERVNVGNREASNESSPNEPSTNENKTEASVTGGVRYSHITEAMTREWMQEFVRGLKSVAKSMGESDNGTEEIMTTGGGSNTTHVNRMCTGDTSEHAQSQPLPDPSWNEQISRQIDVLILQASGADLDASHRSFPGGVPGADWILLQHRRGGGEKAAAMDEVSYAFAHNPWLLYASGFGRMIDANGDGSDEDVAYWLGLETASRLTNFGEWELLLMTKEDAAPSPSSREVIPSSRWRWSIREGFRVGPKWDSFRLSIGNKVRGGGETGLEGNASRDDGEEFENDDLWKDLNGAPFVTEDRRAAMEGASGGGRSNCAHRRVGGWWRNPTAVENCRQPCLNCVLLDSDKNFLLQKETFMAMRRGSSPKSSASSSSARSASSSSLINPSNFRHSKKAIDQVAQKMDEFADNVQMWFKKRKGKNSDHKEGMPDKNEGMDDRNDENDDQNQDGIVKQKTTTTTEIMESVQDELPTTARESVVTYPTTTASTTTTSATTTPLTFDDVNFDSFDDEDYGNSSEEEEEEEGREGGSGSSESKNEAPFNVKNFWEWG